MRISLRICAIFFAFFAQNSFADSYVSTNDVVKEIEKTLLYSKSSREQIDFYKQQKNKRKSDIEINADGGSAKKPSNQISVIVSDVKASNISLREKEQLAYNAVLIGQYEVAIELYKQVIAKEPNNNYSKFALATVYQKINQLRQAKTLYYEMLKSGAENQEEIIGNLLDILIEDSPHDASYLLARLVAQNPDSANILAYSAMAYNKVKNYDQAILMMQKAIVLDQENVGYKYNLAVIYDKSGKYDKAIDLYSEVIRESVGDSEEFSVEQIKKRIEFIKDKA